MPNNGTSWIDNKTTGKPTDVSEMWNRKEAKPRGVIPNQVDNHTLAQIAPANKTCTGNATRGTTPCHLRNATTCNNPPSGCTLVPKLCAACIGAGAAAVGGGGTTWF